MLSSPVFMGLAAAALFGAATPLSKVLLQQLSTYQLAGLLYLGAALGQLPSVLRGSTTPDAPRLDRTTLVRLAGAISFGGVLGPLLLLSGLRLTSATSASLLLNLELVATAILGHLFFRDHLEIRGWIGMAGALGAGLLLSYGAGGAGVAAGVLIASACVCWGIDNQLTALIDRLSPGAVAFWKGLVAGSVNLMIGVWLETGAMSASVVVLALAVGAVSYGVSIALNIGAAQRLGATRAQLLFATAPFFGAVIAVAVLGEGLAGTQVAASAVLALSLALVFSARHSHLHEHTPMWHSHVHRHDDGHHDHHEPGEMVAAQHEHGHEHVAMVHEHPHWSDLHHRHGRPS